jgi:hypothetical protein
MTVGKTSHGAPWSAGGGLYPVTYPSLGSPNMHVYSNQIQSLTLLALRPETSKRTD